MIGIAQGVGGLPLAQERRRAIRPIRLFLRRQRHRLGIRIYRFLKLALRQESIALLLELARVREGAMTWRAFSASAAALIQE
jgi:hypothetical protein